MWWHVCHSAGNKSSSIFQPVARMHYLKAGLSLCSLLPFPLTVRARQLRDCWLSRKPAGNCSLREGRWGGDLSRVGGGYSSVLPPPPPWLSDLLFTWPAIKLIMEESVPPSLEVFCPCVMHYFWPNTVFCSCKEMVFIWGQLLMSWNEPTKEK